MKPHQRRTEGNYPYYKLAVWDARSFTYRDGKVAYDTAEDALAEAEKSPGKYRISAVLVDGRDDLAPFTIT